LKVAGGLSLGTIPLDTLALLQITTLAFSELPQIRQNFHSKSTGQLSTFAVVSQIAGCIARLLTTATELAIHSSQQDLLLPFSLI
jgi:mannose-P-dolichol utilization defect protein 1